MQLKHGLHLAYCTNIHRGESWGETLDALQRQTLAVRDRVCPGKPYAIGLRLSDLASRELSEPVALAEFRRWLDDHQCYVFTINGFPYGAFHATRVKEQVYAPDWTTPERVEYTRRLFDLLVQLLPPGGEGSVSTVPGSFKEFITGEDQVRQMRANLWKCVDHVAGLAERSGRRLHLGLEPEPLAYLETSSETVTFFEQLRAERPGDTRVEEHLGVNYDTCHLAAEFENPVQAVKRFRDHGIRLSKIHLSSALKVRPTAGARRALKPFQDEVYLHQVIERIADGRLRRYRDLDLALQRASSAVPPPDAEWRIHFHVPLHSPVTSLLQNTTDHLLGVLDRLAALPDLCPHLEMETYTWEVLPPELKSRQVTEQLAAEYAWTLRELGVRGLGAD